MLRGDTGFPRADAENDFLRARRRHVLASLAGWVRGRPGGAGRLIPLDDVLTVLGRRGERRLGLQTIRLDTIVGTIDARRDFDARFRPAANRVRPRWERLAMAQRRGEPSRRSRCTGSAGCTSWPTGTTGCPSPRPGAR